MWLVTIRMVLAHVVLALTYHLRVNIIRPTLNTYLRPDMIV